MMNTAKNIKQTTKVNPKIFSVKDHFSFFIFQYSFKKVFGLFFIFCFSLFTYSQTLEDYIEIAKANNSGIKVDIANYKLANEKANQVSYKNTNISAGVFALTPETRVGSQLFKVGVSQSLPWFNELKIKKEQFRNLANVKQYDISLSQRNISFTVKQAYYQLYEEMAKSEILNENKRILKTYEQMALAALSNNRATMSDILRIRVQTNDLVSKIFQNANNILILKENFNRLLERKPDAIVTIPDSLQISAIKINNMSYDKHPSLQKLAATETVLQTKNELIAIDKKPKIKIGLDYVLVDGYSAVNPDQNGKDVLMPKLGISVPIFNKKYKSQYKQVQIEQQILQDQIQVQKINLEMALNQAKLDLDNAFLTAEAAQKNKTEIQRAINVDLKAFETGILDYDKILRLQLQKIRFQLMEISAIKNAFITKAKIEYLTE